MYFSPCVCCPEFLCSPLHHCTTACIKLSSGECEEVASFIVIIDRFGQLRVENKAVLECGNSQSTKKHIIYKRRWAQYKNVDGIIK